MAVIGRSLVAFPRPYTRSPSAMRIVRRRGRTRHRTIASRAFAREKVMRRRKTATATNTHLLGCHGGCHSTLAVRSLHVRVLLLSVRQDVARPSARRGVIFTGSKLGTNESKCSSTFSVLRGCSTSVHPVVEASTELFQLEGRPPPSRSVLSGARRPIDRRAKDRACPSTMGPTPGAYNYVVTVRPPPRVSSASPRGFRCLFAHRHPRDLTSPPTRRRRAGTQTHERDAQRRRELHARRRAEPDRGVRPSRVSNPPPSRRFHDARPSPCSKKRSSTKIRRRGVDVGSLDLSSRASRVSCRLSDALALVSSLV